MGPQLDSCGRPNCGARHSRDSMLQWGRNLTVAEGPHPGASGRAGRVASMGPQLDSCGRRYRRQRSQWHEGSLQWGRNLTVAEGRVREARHGRLEKLQWGRNLTVAEGRHVQKQCNSWACASMGPQLDSCGRRVQGVPRRIRKFLASMGPQLDSCGRLGSAVYVFRVEAELQWGRNLTVAEGRMAAVRAAVFGGLLQWGRNLTVAEGLGSWRL